jgi:ribosomal protein S18 acetylase RimI-like enzyme
MFPAEPPDATGLPSIHGDIRVAHPGDLDVLAPLFDAYRRFYDQPADLALARSFLASRMAASESVILLAQPTGGAAAGFCQLYPTYCSVLAGPVAILYDLFVVDAARREGWGRRLLEAAAAHARSAGLGRLELSTAHDNLRAQALYESAGWKRDETFRVYRLMLE